MGNYQIISILIGLRLHILGVSNNKLKTCHCKTINY